MSRNLPEAHGLVILGKKTHFSMFLLNSDRDPQEFSAWHFLRFPFLTLGLLLPCFIILLLYCYHMFNHIFTIFSPYVDHILPGGWGIALNFGPCFCKSGQASKLASGHGTLVRLQGTKKRSFKEVRHHRTEAYRPEGLPIHNTILHYMHM